ncbi:DUF1499 domain-containing protein [Rhodohalobacter sp. 8-1]|uniref:DUF1499 domain-containing protein n=1 Tax=Rhodohalobacter sp. 8-1 TaxID=3131972 RepID=UPI0030EDF7A5
MKKKLAKSFFYLSLICALVFVMSGYGYQWGIWGLGTGFTLLRYGAYAAIGLAVIQTTFFFFMKDSGISAKAMILTGFLVTLLISATAIYWQYQARSVPPIHDITTDTQAPPEFVAIDRLREDAPNPPEYAGEETAEQQLEAYPDIQPLVLSAPVQEVIDEIVTLISNRGWEIVSINRKEGRVEATEKLAWFGFKDDVVFRVSSANGETRVDMRSKSRIGRSDVGVNAERIREFLTDLEAQIE